MTQGFVWCPHCGKPHVLGDRFCSVSGKPLHPTVSRLVAPGAEGGARLVGATLDGRYRIVGLLGVGGMGEVYEAENLVLQRRVAIKVVISRRIDVEQARTRLLREARAIAAIQHPNICDVYDVGTMPDGNPYLVLERLVGETLHARQKRRRKMSPADAVDVFSAILSGLRAAHCAGIVHRDIKPANVFFVERPGCGPLVKLLDFGFAKDLSVRHDGPRITKPGRACGTLQYMAPEQLRAEEIDARADLFSVGVMLFEALTGQHPFPGATLLEVGHGILSVEAPAITSVRPSLPPEFDAFFARALAKSADARFQSAAEMQAALSAVLPEEPEPPSASDSARLLPRIAPSTSSYTPQ